MSVLIVTSLGDIVVDLFTDKCPLTCKNFLKLCKLLHFPNFHFSNPTIIIFGFFFLTSILLGAGLSIIMGVCFTPFRRILLSKQGTLLGLAQVETPFISKNQLKYCALRHIFPVLASICQNFLFTFVIILDG